MEPSPKKEANEVSNIPMAHTSADPRAVVVMGLTTKAAGATVEGPGRS